MSTNDFKNPDDEQEVYDDLDNTPGSLNQVVHGAPVTSELQSNAPVDWNPMTQTHPTPYGHQNYGFPGQYTHPQYDYGPQNMMTSQYPQQYNHGQQNLMTSQYPNSEFVNQRASNYPVHPPHSTNPNMPSSSMTPYSPWEQSSSNATFGMNPVNDDGSVYDATTVNYGPFRESDRMSSRVTHDAMGHPEHQFQDYEVSPSQSFHSSNADIPSSSMTSPSTSGHLIPTPQFIPNTETNRKRKSTSAIQENSGKRKGEMTRYSLESSHRSEDPTDPLNDALDEEIPDGVKFDTKKLCEEVTAELERHSISKSHFSECVLKKVAGCAEKMLSKTGPLDKMTIDAQHNFRRMFNWTQLSQVQKLACFWKCAEPDPSNQFDTELPDNVHIDTANILRRVHNELALHNITILTLAEKVLGKKRSGLAKMLEEPIPWYNMSAPTQLKFRRLYNYIELPEKTRAAFFSRSRVKMWTTNEKAKSE